MLANKWKPSIEKEKKPRKIHIWIGKENDLEKKNEKNILHPRTPYIKAHYKPICKEREKKVREDHEELRKIKYKKQCVNRSSLVEYLVKEPKVG